MDNNALVAALGSDAVAAVHGYRLEVVERGPVRGLTLRPARPDPDHPIDVRLVFADGPAGVLTGQVLAWGPDRGWSIARSVADAAPRYLAGPLARPLDLVPTPAEVLDRVIGESARLDGAAAGRGAGRRPGRDPPAAPVRDGAPRPVAVDTLSLSA